MQAVAKGPKDVVGKKDLARAEEKVPRGHYKGNCVTQLMLYTGDKLSSPIF